MPNLELEDYFNLFTPVVILIPLILFSFAGVYAVVKWTYFVLPWIYVTVPLIVGILIFGLLHFIIYCAALSCCVSDLYQKWKCHNEIVKLLL